MRLNYYKRLVLKELIEDIAYLYQEEKPSVIFDVGANIGFVTHQFRTFFPNADVYSFEPNPSVFTTLQKSYKDDQKVHPLPFGVGDQNTQILFNLNANVGTSSFLQPTTYHHIHQAQKMLDPILVNIVNLDGFMEQNGLSHINILKLDIEGYELKALEGAKKILAAQKIDVILTEINIVRSYVGQPLFHHLSAFLEEQDYHLFNIDNFVSQETPIRQGVIANAVYLSGNMRKKLQEKFGIENCGW